MKIRILAGLFYLMIFILFFYARLAWAGGQVSQDKLLKIAAEAVQRKDINTFMGLFASAGVDDATMSHTQTVAQSLMDVGLEKTSVSVVVPEGTGRTGGTADATHETGVAFIGYAQFWFKNGRGIFMTFPFGKKDGLYYLIVVHQEATETPAAPQLVQPSKETQAKKAPAAVKEEPPSPAPTGGSDGVQFVRRMVETLDKSKWELTALEPYACPYYKDFSSVAGESIKSEFLKLSKAGGIQKWLKTEEFETDPSVLGYRVNFTLLFNNLANPSKPWLGKQAALLGIAVDKKDGSLCIRGYSVSAYAAS